MADEDGDYGDVNMGNDEFGMDDVDTGDLDLDYGNENEKLEVSVLIFVLN